MQPKNPLGASAVLLAPYWCAFLLAVSCSGGGPLSGKSDKIADAGAGKATSTKTSTAKKTSKKTNAGDSPADDEAPAEDGNDDEDEGGDDGLDDFGGGGDSEGTDPAVQKLLDDCGAGDAINAQPGEIIYQKTGASLPVKSSKTVLGITVTGTAVTDIKITATPEVATQEATVRIVAIEPASLSGVAKSQAEQQAAQNSGTTKYLNVGFSDIPGLGDAHPIWEKVTCGIIPANGVESTRGTTMAKVKFDPPAPLALSPRAVAERYSEEIGDSRVFDGITATVVSSNRPELEGKTTVSGKITFTKVNPEVNVDGKTLKGDIAYKMVANFESPAVTYALGLIPEVTFFISHAKKDFAGNIADTKVEGNPVVTVIFP